MIIRPTFDIWLTTNVISSVVYQFANNLISLKAKKLRLSLITQIFIIVNDNRSLEVVNLFYYYKFIDNNHILLYPYISRDNNLVLLIKSHV